MATTITLSGRLADLTSQPIDPATTTVTVKAPAYAPGPGVELTTTQPATVPVGEDGEITINAVEGVGWLIIDGPGWSDSIRFVAAPGMLTLWEAVVNALPHVVEIKRLLVALHEAYMSSEAGQALPTWLTEAALSSTYATKAEFLLALRDRVDPLVASAIAADQTVVDAAAAAVEGQVAGVIQDVAAEFSDQARTSFHEQSTLPEGANLNSYTGRNQAGTWIISGGATYMNIPPQPASSPRGVLYNTPSGRGGVIQRVTWDHTAEVWERSMTNPWESPPTWTPWKRVDGAALDAVTTRVTGLEGNTFKSFHARVPDNTDFNDMTGRENSGIWTLGTAENYPNLPPSVGNRVQGSLFVFSTGFGDTWQRVIYRYRGGVWDRYETRPGEFTEWVLAGDSSTSETPATPDPPAPPALAPLATTWELSEVVTPYDEGEAYLGRLAEVMPDKVEKISIGKSKARERDISAIILGDGTKPALVMTCGVHGNEVATREAALVWMRKAGRDWPDWMDHICVVIAPTINADKITEGRLNGNLSDINRNWPTRTLPEVHAILNLLHSFDTRFYIDCHEGGRWEPCEIIAADDDSIPAEIAATSTAMYEAVWAKLVERGLPVDRYTLWEDYTYDQISSMGWHAVARTEGIPTLLVETPSGYTGNWSGPGPHPAVYTKPMQIRMDMYYAVFDAAAEWLVSNI